MDDITLLKYKNARTFGQRVRLARLEKSMSQKRLAESSGISVNGIANYEHDVTEPLLFSPGCIADALGVSLDWLAGRTEQRRASLESTVQRRAGSGAR